jgi:hypothetical protein
MNSHDAGIVFLWAIVILHVWVSRWRAAAEAQAKAERERSRG